MMYAAHLFTIPRSLTVFQNMCHVRKNPKQTCKPVSVAIHTDNVAASRTEEVNVKESGGASVT